MSAAKSLSPGASIFFVLVVVLSNPCRQNASSAGTEERTSETQPCEEAPLADLDAAIREYSKIAQDLGTVSEAAREQALAIGHHYSTQRELDDARKWYERALEGIQWPPRTAQEASAYQGLGWALGRARQLQEAIQDLSLAVGGWQLILGPGSACEGVAREHLATCLLTSGETEKGLDEYARSMCILAESLGKDSAPYLRACHGFANALAFQGHLDEALPYYLRVSEARHRLLAPNDPALAWICHDLALALHGLGRFLEAEPNYREAMEIRQGHFPALYRQSAIGLASCLTDRGDYLGARQVVAEVSNSLQTDDHPDPYNRASTLQALAALRLQMQDFDEADRLYRLVIEALKEDRDKHPHLENVVYANLAEIARHSGNLTLADSLQHRALAIRETLYGPTSPFVLRTKGGLADILAEEGKIPEADTLFQEVLTKLAHWGNGSAYLYGNVAQAYALMLWKSRRLAEAAAWIDSTILAFGTILPPGHERRIRAYETASAIHLEARNATKAWKEALIAEQEGQRALVLNIQGMAEPTAFLYKQTAARGLPVLLRMLAQSQNPSAEMTRTAWEGLIASRNVVTDELRDRRRMVLTPKAKGLWDDIREERQQLERLFVQGPRPTKEHVYPRAVAELEDHLASLEEQLALLSPRSTRTPESLEALSKTLDERSALVSIATFEEVSGEARQEIYGAFILRSAGVSPRFVRLCPTESLRSLLAELQEHMEAAPSLLRLDPDGAEDEYRRIGTAIRKAVWEPLCNVLSGVDKVYLVPDGDVWRVSFQSLPTAEGKYLVESGPAIHVIGAEEDLLNAEVGTVRSGILIVGGVDYDLCEESPDRAHSPGLSKPFSPLPGSRREADDVMSIWSSLTSPGSEFVIELSGERATEDSVFRLTQQVGVVHLATHGFLPRVGNENDRSRWMGIALSGANGGGCTNDDDGILTAVELSQLHLEGTRLVFLSSCGSGLGTSIPTEGIVGFQRALRVAGCRSVILSLWDLPDRPTRDWVERFYSQYVPSRCPAAAARIACTETLSARRSFGRATHPFYWGGFAVLGALD